MDFFEVGGPLILSQVVGVRVLFEKNNSQTLKLRWNFADSDVFVPKDCDVFLNLTSFLESNYKWIRSIGLGWTKSKDTASIRDHVSLVCNVEEGGTVHAQVAVTTLKQADVLQINFSLESRRVAYSKI